MRFDVKELKKEMHAFEDSIQRLADALGVSRQNVSGVLNGKQDFTYPQLIQIAARYNLSPERFYEIFIKPTVDDYF